MTADLEPFHHHPASPDAIETMVTQMGTLSTTALDLDAVTRAAHQPAEENWEGICAAELRNAPVPVRRKAEEGSSGLAWAGVALQHWASRIREFNSSADALVAEIDEAGLWKWGASGTDGEAPTREQVNHAKREFTNGKKAIYHEWVDLYIVEGAKQVADMLKNGPTEQNLRLATGLDALVGTPGAFSAFYSLWHNQNVQTDSAEAVALALKFNRERVLWPDDVARLKELLVMYEDDPAFAYAFMTALGPQDLLRLNGNLAELVEYPDPTPGMYDYGTAEMVGPIQLALGLMLASATREPVAGNGTGPGPYSVGPEWIDDLVHEAAKTYHVGPAGEEEFYGYQLLGPLLRHGDYSNIFLDKVGTHMIEFDRDHGGLGSLGPSGLTRLDYSDGPLQHHPDDNDPLVALMEQLDRNPEAARRVFVDDDGQGAERVGYLLDRYWMPNDGDSGYHKLGLALEGATLVDPDSRSSRIVEEIVHTLGDSDKTFHPGPLSSEITQSMANITAGYIYDVNRGLSSSELAMFPGSENGPEFEKLELRRFLAHLGEDQASNDTVRAAETLWAKDMFERAYSGPNAAESLDGKLRGAQTVIDSYARITGTLDFGLSDHLQETAPKALNAPSEQQQLILDGIAYYAKQGIDKGLETIPAPGFITHLVSAGLNHEVDGVLHQNVDDSAAIGLSRADAMLTNGQIASSDLAIVTLYNSGAAGVPDALKMPDGSPKPFDQFTSDDLSTFKQWVTDKHMGEFAFLGDRAAEAYYDVYTQDDAIMNPD